jgi:uncharacterized protein (DUF111 family)
MEEEKEKSEITKCNNETKYEEENINIISRQTTLSRNEIIIKLIEHDNNILNIIREWNGIKKLNKQEENIKLNTVNQEIYKQMRNKFSTNFIR